MVDILHKDKKIALFFKDQNEYAINYESRNIKESIALSLPNSKKFYTWNHRFPPFLESFLPEGYLYEIFKNIIAKEHGEVNDYLIFSLLASNIENRITFQSKLDDFNFPSVDMDEILLNDSSDTFEYLIKTFLNKNAISGVQPKTLAIVKDKDSLNLKEHIVKTWGEEYPNLAENEYFCLKAVEKAGVPIPKVQLSQNKKFLVVEKFTYKEYGELWGFEEVISLMDKNREKKYSGSYEQVANVIYSFSTNKKESMQNFFKTVVMNYLLKNGDAHLKNFGLLFSDDFSEIKFAPAYDIVNTTVYIFKDKPALTLAGKKIWWSKVALLKFAQQNCFLSKNEALQAYQECFDALKFSIERVKKYIGTNPNFSKIGNKMVDTWNKSLLETDIKEIDDELIRSWKES
jgi:serine/threonine-protein kinase HipA